MYENDLHLQVASLKRLLITLYFLLLLGALANNVQARELSAYETPTGIIGAKVTEITAGQSCKIKFYRGNLRFFSFNP